jgi:glutaminase
LLELLEASGVSTADSLDHALERCEDELLARADGVSPERDVPLHEHQLCQGLTPEELAFLEPQLGLIACAPGATVVRGGETAEEVYLVTHGTLSVLGLDGGDRPYRVATLSAGMTFGELAFVDRTRRRADVRADTRVGCRTLSYALLDALATDAPALYGKLVTNLLRCTASWVVAADRELAYLTR